jgi:tRNA(Ile)-lysidine synthase
MLSNKIKKQTDGFLGMVERKVWRYIKEHSLIEAGDRIVVAVSGGPDSLCLLHLLNRISSSISFDLVVAHMNHSMRPEADDEADMVQDLAAAFSLPFYKKKENVVKFAAEHNLSVEEAGRNLRYRFLQEVARQSAAAKIAVGHHRDDQAETVLFNLLRGTGPDGLAGMLPCRTIGKTKLIRPLLTLSRLETEAYCRDNGLRPALDSTNRQTGYTRNRIRLDLLPHLEKNYNPRVKEALARLSSLAAEDRRFLQEQTARALKFVSRAQGNRMIISKDRLRMLPQALRSRVARLALERYVMSSQVEWTHVHSLLSLTKETGADCEIALPGKARLYRVKNLLVIAAKKDLPEAFIGEKILRVPGRTTLPGGGWIEAQICTLPELIRPLLPGQGYLDYEQLPSLLVARGRWPGARFYPQGAAGGKKLKDFFIDQKVLRDKRDSWPLVTTPQGEIVWVAGLRIAHPYRLTSRTEKVMILKWQEKRSPARN